MDYLLTGAEMSACDAAASNVEKEGRQICCHPGCRRAR